MAKPENLTWGTLEELLLACAVDRHGTSSWGSVAKEMQKRTSAFNCFNSQSCEQKHHDLKRRFTSEIDRGSQSGGDASPWLDELRRRRIAELKRELERYDLSIVSLQLKVKRLSEEREKSEEENKSLDDLNSPGEKLEEQEAEGVVEGAGHPPVNTTEPESEEEWSKCDATGKTESGESVAESIGGEDDGRLGKETGRVESGDGHSRKKGRRNSVSVEEESAAVKPEWVVDFLEEIRRHDFGSAFERRLDSQETPSYKKLIRRHVDLGTIRTRLKAGQYAESASKFHCDLLLLATNAAVFFPRTTPENKAALELRQLVSTKFTNHPPKPSTNPPSPPTLQPHPTLEPDSPPLFKYKLSSTVVASRKGTNIVPKPSVGHTQAKNDEEKEKERTEKPSWFSMVTKKRTKDQSLAPRSSGADTLSNQSSPDRPSSSKGPKNEKPKTEGKEKKKSVANFLNRIKSSSSISDLTSIQGETKGARCSKEGPSKDQGNASRKGSSPASARDKGKQRDGSNCEGSNRIVGRPSKKSAAEANKGKRTRESGGDKAEVAPSKKRSRK